MEKSLIEEMTPDQMNSLRQLLDYVLAELSLREERRRLMDERMKKDWEEIEQIKRETRIISERTDRFMATHFGAPFSHQENSGCGNKSSI